MGGAGTSLKLSRVMVAVLLAGLVLLGLMVTLALAQIELPPGGSVAFIQTSGPNTGLNIGDWYTRFDQGNRPHSFKIFVPCTGDPNQVFTVELFDPEVFTGTIVIDEMRPSTIDDATFELRAPDNSVVATLTYTPSAATNDQWVNFTTFTTGAFGCGTYTLLVSTSDNDDNAWRLRLSPDDPDGSPGTGDELLLASFEASFQHTAFGCQEFFFFVPVTPSIRLNNFDLDFPGFDPDVTITYFQPDGSSGPGTASGQTLWNNGGGAGHPPPGGDVISDPMPGWWRTQICARDNNQYIFEPEGLTHFFQQPPVPDMTVSKDDGLTVVAPGQIITYTISYANSGQGAALNTILAETLPTSTTFVACSGGLSCGEVPPAGSGIVTYALGTIPGGVGGQVNLTLQVGAVAPSSTLTNTAQLDYTDTMNNDYPPLQVRDINVVPSPSPIPTPTSTPTFTPPPTPRQEEKDDSPPPTPTPTTTPTSLPSAQLTATAAALSLAAPNATATVLPVTFLPETGIRDAELVYRAIMALGLLISCGASLTALWFWRKREKR